MFFPGHNRTKKALAKVLNCNLGWPYKKWGLVQKKGGSFSKFILHYNEKKVAYSKQCENFFCPKNIVMSKKTSSFLIEYMIPTFVLKLKVQKKGKGIIAGSRETGGHRYGATIKILSNILLRGPLFNVFRVVRCTGSVLKLSLTVTMSIAFSINMALILPKVLMTHFCSQLHL